MEYNYGRYYSTDFAIDLYFELINMVKQKRPNIKNCESVCIPNHPVVFTRIFATSFSSHISRINELILDIEDESVHQEVEQTIEEVINRCQIFDKIKPKEPMSKSELKQQIKNALAHAEYTIGHEEEGICFLEISSPKLTGRITIKDLDTISRVYTEIYNSLTTHNSIYDAEELLTQQTNNKNNLRKSISCITKGTLPEGECYQPQVTVFGIDGVSQDVLSPEQQQLIYDYIMYVGLQNWIELPYEERMKDFVHVLRPQLENKILPYGEGFNILRILSQLLYPNETKESFFDLEFEFPIIYADLLLELGFLCLNHIKESQAKEKLPDFNYHDISLKGIRYSPKECVRLVTKEEQETKYHNQLRELYSVAEKERAALARIHEDIIKLQQSEKIPQSKKQELLARKQQSLERAEQSLNKITNQIYDYEDRLEIAEDYIETNDFFKHLRNSISHGLYTVDISNGLKEKDLGKTIFHFEDWDISKTNRKERTKVFSADITGDQLMRLFTVLRDRLIESANSIDQQEDKRVIFNDLCDPPMAEEKVKELYKKYTSRGATVIKHTQKES